MLFDFLSWQCVWLLRPGRIGSSTYFHACPRLKVRDQRCSIFVMGSLGYRVLPDLLHRLADPHRNPEFCRLLHSKRDVLGGDGHPRAVVESAWQNRARELISAGIGT